MATIVNTFPDKSFGAGGGFGQGLGAFFAKRQQDKEKEELRKELMAYEAEIANAKSEEDLNNIPNFTSRYSPKNVEELILLNKHGNDLKDRRRAVITGPKLEQYIVDNKVISLPAGETPPTGAVRFEDFNAQEQLATGRLERAKTESETAENVAQADESRATATLRRAQATEEKLGIKTESERSFKDRADSLGVKLTGSVKNSFRQADIAEKALRDENEAAVRLGGIGNDPNTAGRILVEFKKVLHDEIQRGIHRNADEIMLEAREKIMNAPSPTIEPTQQPAAPTSEGTGSFAADALGTLDRTIQQLDTEARKVFELLTTGAVKSSDAPGVQDAERKIITEIQNLPGTSAQDKVAAIREYVVKQYGITDEEAIKKKIVEIVNRHKQQ